MHEKWIVTACMGGDLTQGGFARHQPEEGNGPDTGPHASNIDYIETLNSIHPVSDTKPAGRRAR